MKTAILIGLSPSTWDEMTPYELNLSIEAFVERKEAESIENITLVWLGEYYHRIKKLPRLDEVTRKLKPKKKMTDQEMLETVKQLNAMFGGTVETEAKSGECHS